jgi:phosphotransferase system enzyme I (PtsI)
MEVILNGTDGTVLLEPGESEIAAARHIEGRRRRLAETLADTAGQPAVTLDGARMTLRGNVDLPEDLESAVQHGADGVGLLRTEFLLLGRTAMPSEDEQAAFFRRVVDRFAGRTVVVRSYDLGGDKFPAAFRPPREANPFLGWRAIRVCLDFPDIFRTQIRAILRARAHGDVCLMLPLVTQVEEIERTRELVSEAAESLTRLGVEAADTLPVGVMIETPAAAILADQMAERSDFLSVGTNDLTQYTLAVDRGNARLAERFTPLHPAVVRMLRRIVEAGHRVGLEPSVCGEMASDPMSTFLLMGLGYRVLSVAPRALPLVRWLVRQVDLVTAERAADAVLACSTTRDTVAVLEEALAKHVDLDLVGRGRLPGDSGTATLKAQTQG